MKKIICLYIIIFNTILTAQENKIISYTFENTDGFRCNSSLYIVKEESIFRIEDNREDGVQHKSSNEEDFYKVVNDGLSKIFYSTNNESIIRIPLYKSEIVYKQDTSNLNYVFTGKNRKINKFNCQEATLDLNDRKYFIWFTTEVPINFGPFKINGLPGLIVELYEETNKIKFTLKSIKNLLNTSEFDKYKKYIKKKSPLDYNKYEQKIVDLMIVRKTNAIAKVKEIGGEVNFTEDQSFFTQFIIDIPTNLVTELQRIN